MNTSAFKAFMLTGMIACVGMQGITVTRLRVSPAQVFGKLSDVEAELDVREKRFERIEYQQSINTLATRWRITSIELRQWIEQLQKENPTLVVPQFVPLDEE